MAHTKKSFFILLIFTGNVDCKQGSVLSIGKECPVLGQCLAWQSLFLHPTGQRYLLNKNYFSMA